MYRLPVILFLLLLTVPEAALAVSFRFELIARTVDDTAGVTGLNVDDPLAIEIWFEDDPVDLSPLLDTKGLYLVREVRYAFPSGDFVRLVDDYLDAQLVIYANDPVRDAMGFTLPRMSLDGVFDGQSATLAYGSQNALWLQDNDGLWLQSDSLPTSFLELSEYESISQNTIRLTVGSDPTAYVNTTLVGITVVPEPSTGILALMGLLWLSVSRRFAA